MSFQKMFYNGFEIVSNGINYKITGNKLMTFTTLDLCKQYIDSIKKPVKGTTVVHY